MHYRIGVDIGGTFTDFALFDDMRGLVWTHKQLTTPEDPSRSVMDGVPILCAQAGISLTDVGTLVHGTTLVTNAVIERKGVSTAMLVTRGFRDVLDIGLERRYDIFDLRIGFPKPVVPRHLRIEVSERMGYDGKSIQPPDFAGLEDALDTAIRQHKIEAIAVCFLHSYFDARHEEAAAEWLAQRFPDLAICTSAEVFPFMREYDRWTTAGLNAYMLPIVDRYLSRLERGLADIGFKGNFFIMSSSGGTLTTSVARRFPIRMLESGPAAGALMSARHGRALGLPQLLSFDMGGTTAKGCIIQDGRPLKNYVMEVARVHDFKKGSGLPVRIPVIDMIEIGAGGGSLAAVDERGTLRVGPTSAGANPGPACYGRGGTRATLTDANLVLGYLGTESFLGGRMHLDLAASRKAIEHSIASLLNIAIDRAAWGKHDVINEDVARAIRVHAAERGVDYRRCSMVAFGGSGPLHAVHVARKLRIPRVICPWGAGVMSAFGLLASPAAFELLRSHRIRIDHLSPQSFGTEFQKLSMEAARFLLESGVATEDIRTLCRLDMRYVGQGYEVEVELPAGREVVSFSSLSRLFHDAYRKVFGISFEDRAIEIVSWKVEAHGPLQGESIRYSLAQTQGHATALKAFRMAYMPEPGGYVDCPVYDRYALEVGSRINGPALIEEYESTCVLGPGDTGQIDEMRNLVIELVGAA